VEVRQRRQPVVFLPAGQVGTGRAASVVRGHNSAVFELNEGHVTTLTAVTHRAHCHADEITLLEGVAGDAAADVGNRSRALKAPFLLFAISSFDLDEEPGVWVVERPAGHGAFEID